MRKHALIALSFIAVPVLVAACGGGTPTPGTPTGPSMPSASAPSTPSTPGTPSAPHAMLQAAPKG